MLSEGFRERSSWGAAHTIVALAISPIVVPDTTTTRMPSTAAPTSTPTSGMKLDLAKTKFRESHFFSEATPYLADYSKELHVF